MPERRVVLTARRVDHRRVADGNVPVGVRAVQRVGTDGDYEVRGGVEPRGFGADRDYGIPGLVVLTGSRSETREIGASRDRGSGLLPDGDRILGRGSGAKRVVSDGGQALPCRRAQERINAQRRVQRAATIVHRVADRVLAATTDPDVPAVAVGTDARRIERALAAGVDVKVFGVDRAELRNGAGPWPWLGLDAGGERRHDDDEQSK